MNLFSSTKRVNGFSGMMGTKLSLRLNKELSDSERICLDRLKIFTVCVFYNSFLHTLPPLLPHVCVCFLFMAGRRVRTKKYTGVSGSVVIYVDIAGTGSVILSTKSILGLVVVDDKSTGSKSTILSTRWIVLGDI